MEYLAWLAAETHSDHPRTACPVLAAFTRALNDYMPDATRQHLRPYLGRMIRTADDGLSAWRAWEIVEWAERDVYPLVWYSPIAWARLSQARRMAQSGDYFGAVQGCADVMYRAGLARPVHWGCVWPLLERLLPLAGVDPGERTMAGPPSVQPSATAG